MSVPDFFAKIAPYAMQTSSVTNIPASVIMAQLALESGYGTSSLSQKNNLGGIKFVSQNQASGSSGGFATYASIDKFFEDYTRVMKLSFYKDVRDAGDVPGTVKALALSPYDAGHYGGSGTGILDIIQRNNLTQYDGMQPVGTAYKNPSTGAIVLAIAGVGLITLLLSK